MMLDVRLIDANAIVEKLQNYYETLSPDIYSEMIRRDEVSSCIAELINAHTVDAQPTADINVKFNESDFTDEELKMLKAIFKGADAVVQSARVDNYDTFMSNTLYSLTQKLGIDDIVD